MKDVRDITDRLSIHAILGHMTVAMAGDLADEIAAEEQTINLGKLNEEQIEAIKRHVMRTLYAYSRGDK